MICHDCRDAASQAREVLDAGVPTALPAAMAGHEKCKGGTWCECTHQIPRPR